MLKKTGEDKLEIKKCYKESRGEEYHTTKQ
jgi:hypothetical protein